MASFDNEKLAHASQSLHSNTVELDAIDDFKRPETTQVHLISSREKHDEALDLLALRGQNITYVSAQDDARILRKIDRKIMPIVFTIFLLQLLDKQTITLSSVLGLARETNLSGDEYSLLVSIVFIAELVCQPLSAYLLVKCRLSIYIPIVVTCWGVTLTCMAAARNYHGLLISRVFLGVFEASVSGSVILVAQTWYRRHEQGFRIAIWHLNTGLGNIFGTLLMFGIGHIKSAVLHPYQIVSLILGGVTVIVGLLSFSLFPDNPVRSKFLTTEEKLLAVERIRANQQGLEVKVFKMTQVYEMLLDFKSWCWMLLSVLISIPAGGMGSYGPLILRGFGFSGDTVMLLLVPYGVMQICSLALGFWLNKRYSMKWLVLIGAVVPCIIGTTLILMYDRHAKSDGPILLFAYYLSAPLGVAFPTIINWQSSNVAGHTKKNATTAFMAMGNIAGSMIGPLLFNSQDKPYYHAGLIKMLIFFGISIFMVAITVIYLRYLNEVNRKRRISRGKAGKIVDYSMLSAAAAEEEHQKNLVSTGLHAFDDLTDLQNDEFIYVY